MHSGRLVGQAAAAGQVVGVVVAGAVHMAERIAEFARVVAAVGRVAGAAGKAGLVVGHIDLGEHLAVGCLLLLVEIPDRPVGELLLGLVEAWLDSKCVLVPC